MRGCARSGRGVAIGAFALICRLPASSSVAGSRARAHRVKAHRNTMLGLFFGALVIAGVFTLWPGRVMHEAVFGK